LSIIPALFSRNAPAEPKAPSMYDLLLAVRTLDARTAGIEAAMERLLEALEDDPEAGEAPKRDLQGELLPRERNPDEPL
jgi:hypothetical protein